MIKRHLYIFTLIFSLAILVFNVYFWFLKLGINFTYSEFTYVVHISILAAAFVLGFLNLVVGVIAIIRPNTPKIATIQKCALILLLLIAVPFIYVFLQAISGNGVVNYYNLVW